MAAVGRLLGIDSGTSDSSGTSQQTGCVLPGRTAESGIPHTPSLGHRGCWEVQGVEGTPPSLLQLPQRSLPWGRSCSDQAPLHLLRQPVLTRYALVHARLHTSSWQADSNRASLTRVHRQAYARLYPVLLVKQDGSTIHIRYREPRRMLEMPVDLDTLSPEERRARFRKREAQLRKKEKEEPELSDDFDMEQYKRFWTKK
ncbi:large ribosomal subunit protein mL55 isoform X1 [Mustela lutreola]|nr:large ribosomal subunit protein mL55 isoform X1 [Mustela lutreola]XP_059032078.1 large ribosomal subunit protein mL55 isoform X1 [Mustela lutreola]XP_059032079.1 large ribosomal subunit protein mL55 isoform X1 [Mustela lutreola]XP_059032080.1 large ribosomal subunit protein mL55 isoform X1 [Mustela lutreola]XP_059032081.1 large ribosomal subunit protein mL55 isoform X1 [Mustela lutreola]